VGLVAHEDGPDARAARPAADGPATVDVVVEVQGTDLEVGERVGLARLLQSELRNVRGAEVEPARAGAAPAGGKAAEALSIGALVLALAPEAFPLVVQIVTGWLARQRVGIKVTIDDQTLEGTVTPEQRDAIVSAFLARLPKK
jgi:hypothetical protein